MKIKTNIRGGLASTYTISLGGGCRDYQLA
jgi:hypothetical protein